MVDEISFDLPVCNPLTRRCLLLPPIPDDLLASFQAQKKNFLHFDALLVPSMDEEDGASFKVIAVMLLLVFIFSSVTGQWSALKIPLDEGDHVVTWFSNNTYGCFYCCVEPNYKCFKFDMSSMEFSAVDLPPGCDGSDFIIVEAGEGRLGMFILINDGTSVRYTIWQIGGEMHDQSKMDNTILPLPVGYYYTIDGPYEGHIIISGYQSTSTEDFAIYFTLEIKTLKLERVCQTRSWLLCPYFVFPPSMSQRRI
ncbi:hypothetical protein BS78_03G374400 [Paspalum vaginatum]|nr:hypothetical protein BS78_03G374400 [Paspalum vaginatum]